MITTIFSPSELLRAISLPKAQAIVNVLAVKRVASISEIALGAFDDIVPDCTIYYHLRKLITAGIVVVNDTEATHQYYLPSNYKTKIELALKTLIPQWEDV